MDIKRWVMELIRENKWWKFGEEWDFFHVWLDWRHTDLV